MATIRKQSIRARTRAVSATTTAAPSLGDLQRSADEILALLNLFGHTLHSHRQVAVCDTCPAWGSAELGTLEDRAATRLRAAIKKFCRYLGSRHPAKRVECFEELAGAANECMVLVDLFGSAIISYRKTVRAVAKQHPDTDGLAILYYRGMDRLKTAVEAHRNHATAGASRR